MYISAGLFQTLTRSSAGQLLTAAAAQHGDERRRRGWRREARGGLRAAREGGAAAVLDSRAGSDDVDVDVDGHTTG